MTAANMQGIILTPRGYEMARHALPVLTGAWAKPHPQGRARQRQFRRPIRGYFSGAGRPPARGRRANHLWFKKTDPRERAEGRFSCGFMNATVSLFVSGPEAEDYEGRTTALRAPGGFQ
jgi:hypothetical protein